MCRGLEGVQVFECSSCGTNSATPPTDNCLVDRQQEPSHLQRRPEVAFKPVGGEEVVAVGAGGAGDELGS
jgi:hypothetical protein